MGTVFIKVLNMGLTASWLILAVVVLRLFLKKAPKWISCLLWALVAFRLVCPFSIESALSLIPSSEPLPENIVAGSTFRADTGVGIGNVQGPADPGEHGKEGSPVTVNQGNHIMDLLGIIWITGVMILLLYCCISYYRMHRMTAVSIHRGDGIYLCDHIDTPFILGIIAPRICLPSGLDPSRMEYVIAHERAHLKRRDHWWKIAGFLILSVYWFHPLCWVSYILLCRDIELACDEKVVRSLGQESRKAYAEALLSCSVRQSGVGACPLAFGEVGVKERVKNVLDYKKPAFRIILAAVLCCLAAAVCFLTSPKEEEESTSYAEEERADLSEFVEKWTEAFINRDGERIAAMMSPELAEDMRDALDDFGFSSPWPWDIDTDCLFHIYEEERDRAEIYYYAHTSDPHVTCWKETLWFERDGDGYAVSKEELNYYDNIATAEEFKDAYITPGSLDGSMMDYTKNGLGEALNENALLSSSMAYRALFEPGSAAAFLLNLSDDPKKVRYMLHEPGGSGLVSLDITFLEDGETFTISMLQPYGENGIWVPTDERADVIAKMMKTDTEEWRHLSVQRDIPEADFSGIICIGEIPEKGIRLYGYNDEEITDRGVVLEMGEDFYYFDWYYTSPQRQLPELNWDEEKQELQISCKIHAGTGVSAEELHILRFGDNTMQESHFGLEDYCALLEERIGWSFDEETRSLVLTDKKSGEALQAVTIPKEQGDRVTGVELGMLSGFDLGGTMRFHVYTGYYMDETYGVAEYEGMPYIVFELVTGRMESGDIIFELGDMIA